MPHPRIAHDPETDWHLREVERFNDGTYTCPPWLRCPECNKDKEFPYFYTIHALPKHFAHISKKDPNLIAYIKDDKNGERDVQTQIKPGRYLKQFYPTLGDTTIATLAGLLLLSNPKQDVLEYGETPDDMENVFLNGPKTCMGKPVDQYLSNPIHPTRAYAGPDLKVVYVRNPQSKKISARALIWPAKKIYAQLVGDYGTYETLLKNTLSTLGYKKGSLEGARISLIKPEKSPFENKPNYTDKLAFIAPVIDNCNNYRVDEESQCLVIQKNGPVVGYNYGSGIFYAARL